MGLHDLLQESFYSSLYHVAYHVSVISFKIIDFWAATNEYQDKRSMKNIED
jgi:hypothetical protein